MHADNLTLLALDQHIALGRQIFGSGIPTLAQGEIVDPFGLRLNRAVRRVGARILNREGIGPQFTDRTAAMDEDLKLIGLVEMLYQEMTTEITQILWSARTPVDDNTVRSYGFQARNSLGLAQAQLFRRCCIGRWHQWEPTLQAVDYPAIYVA